MSRRIHFLVPLLALVSSPVATRQVLLGPAFATPSNLAAVELIQSTAASLVQSFEEALTQGTSSFGNFVGNATSLSLTAASTDDAGPFFDFHFSSPQLNTSAGSVSEVTADSIYRIGSISKLFTVYGLLLDYGTGNWDRPVTDFIPELRVAESSSNPTAVSQVQWDKVTIGSLASQLSGIGRDCTLHPGFALLNGQDSDLDTAINTNRLGWQITTPIWPVNPSLGMRLGYPYYPQKTSRLALVTKACRLVTEMVRVTL